MIGDFNRDEQVWNYPIYEYRYSYERNGARLNRDEAFAETRSTLHSDYAFNKEAQAFVVVNMDLYYAKALDETVNDDNSNLPPDRKRRRLRYILELDSEENIIGGEWLGWEEGGSYQPGSRQNHLDFIWIPFEPGEPSGNRTGGNPHISAKEVLSMWGESRGFLTDDPTTDPNNPNTILSAPSDTEEWGNHTPWYSLILDGQSTGAVFVRGELKMTIEPQNKLAGNYDVEVLLNGQKIRDISFSGTPISSNITPRVGMNHLVLRWLQGGSEVAGPSSHFRFYAMR